MQTKGCSALVTGGASGLDLATVKRLIAQGAKVVIADLPTSNGEAIARELGVAVRFVPADVTSESQMIAACDAAEALAPLRVLVNCAGRRGALRLVEKDGSPGSLEAYEAVVRTNLIGTFNALRLAASRMAKNEPVEDERGVCVLTASVAAYEGQIGQVPYASAKAGIVGMTLVAARDLAGKAIRVCTNRPEARNAATRAIAQGVAAALDELDRRSDLSAAIITGAGGTFCSEDGSEGIFAWRASAY